MDPSIRFHKNMPLADRIKAGVVVDPATGCWLWQRSTNYGYGHVRYKGATYQAHRVAYEQFVGPIPEGMELLHRDECPRRCCNPDHLTPGTHAENMAQYMKKNTHCRRGHEYAVHQRIRKDGKRVCGECLKINRKREKERHA